MLTFLSFAPAVSTVVFVAVAMTLPSKPAGPTARVAVVGAGGGKAAH